MTPLLPLLLLLAHALAQCPDVLTLTDKVINGNPSQPTYQISLSSPPNPAVRRCTASRIAPAWALTAAHCNVNASWTATIAGATVHTGTPARVAQVHTHPSYQQPTDRRFDIALVQLDLPTPPAPLPEHAVVRLNDHARLPLAAAYVRVAGYGAVDTSSTPEFGALTHVDIPTVPFDECARLYRGTPNLGRLDPRRQLCAGYPHGGCDACSGDSGGPIVQFDGDGRAVQVGLVSASRGCALPGFPGIAVRTDAFLDWIRGFGVEIKTGRGLQVLKASGGRIVTKDPPSDTGAVNDDAVNEAPPPMVSNTPVPSPSASAIPAVVSTPTPPRPEKGVDNRLPSPSPSGKPASKPGKPGKPGKTGKGDGNSVGKPIGPRVPPTKPAPNGEETLEGFPEEEDDEDVGASAEPEGQTGALAGDVEVGAEITGRRPVAAIAGGAVGGLLLVGLVIAGFVFLSRNQGSQGSQETDIEQTESDDTAQHAEA